MLLFRPHPISLLLLWLLTFGKRVTSQTGCNCPGGCNLTDVCYTTDCSEKNVAVGKTAESSSLYNNSHPACRAVNGITDSDGDCTETAQNDFNPFWRVDLGQKYTIQHMTIYGRAVWSIRMVGLKILVDNELCATINNSPYYRPSDGPPVPISIRCNQSITGRYVTLFKNFTRKDFTHHPEILSVCEVQVWATPLPTTTTSPTPTTLSTTTPTIRTTTSEPSSGETITLTGVSPGSTTVLSTEDSPPNTTTAIPVALFAGTVGAVVALLIAVIIVVFVVMRMKRGNHPEAENSKPCSTHHQADNVATVAANDSMPDRATPAAQDQNTDNTASATDNVYEIIEDSGHYYEPLSHRDNTYINDNTLYTSPVFPKGKEEGGTSLIDTGNSTYYNTDGFKKVNK